MNLMNEEWSKEHEEKLQKVVYPTEWVIRTIAGANYPNFKYDKSKYRGKKILDASCGDGRNLQFLLDQGFDVYATEISEEIIGMLSKRFPDVRFRVGFNHLQPFPDDYFDYAMSCRAFYYLFDDTHFSDNVKELSRIMKPKAIFYSDLPTIDTYILRNATELKNGEYLITDDPHKLRNGVRWQVTDSLEEIKKLFSPYFKVLASSKLHDDFFGYLLSYHVIVGCNK